MAEDNKMKRCPVTLQPDIEELLDWNNYSADDFDSASQTEKKGFHQELSERFLLEGCMAPSEEECGCDGCSWCDHFPGIVCICWSISGSLWI